MWIFGQVWFACLVGFAVGVLLDWVVRVRPLTHQVADLESRLRNSPRTDAESDDSMFGRRSYEAPGRFDSTGFGGDSSRGLLTPAGPTSLATDLMPHELQTQIAEPPSGVEDYPGVARLSGIWADDPEQSSESLWASADQQADTPTTVAPLVPPVSQVPPPSEADEQYLDFLRSGSGTSADRDAEGAFDDRDELVDESPRETPAEVTSVLPAVEGYGAYEGYAQDDFTSNNGYQHNGYQSDYQDSAFTQPSRPDGYDHDGYQLVDYQQEDLADPGESSMPLPHRDTSEHTPRRYAPFEIPFDQLDSSDIQPRAGDVTPIGDGGFQPFQKPGDDGGPDTDDLGWFDMSAAAPPTPRSLPIAQPGATYSDLLGESVFGNAEDHGYQEDGEGRSLFEPVIAPDSVEDYPPPQDAPMFDPTGGQGTTPRPIRVRTGVESTGPTPIIGNGHEAPAGPFGPGSALPLPDGRAPSPEFRIKARTSSMVFHTESSPFYERLEPQVWFRDQQDAQRAGFTSWERPRSW
jgi:hypothetical protein